MLEESTGVDLGGHVLGLGSIAAAILELDHRHQVLAADLERARARLLFRRHEHPFVLDALSLQRLLNTTTGVETILVDQSIGETTAMELDSHGSS